MSYCVHCGVELSDYHKECPLCETSVINPNISVEKQNIDYPEYTLHQKHNGKWANRLFTGMILSLLSFVYAIVPVLINLVISKQISWSLITLISVTLAWFGVALPFFRKRNSFFKLFSYDSIAVIIYLLLLNYIISGNFGWARFTTLSIIIVWTILSGIFIPDHIRRFLPLKVYFILHAVIISLLFAFLFNSELSILYILLPINIIILVLSILSYFIITASIHDFLGLLIVLVADVSIFAVSLNLILSKYLVGAYSITWSGIVLVVTIPLIAVSFSIRKGKQVRKFIEKNLHR